jgi:hypothetical protein
MYILRIQNIVASVLVCIMPLAIVQSSQAFTHPGLLNNAADLARAKSMVSSGTEPWRSAWERLTNSVYPGVSGTYTPAPIANITDSGSFNDKLVMNDGEAAYVNAIQYSITGTTKYATTCMNILNAWSTTCTNINGSNAQLVAGIDFFNMVNAAEIIRYSGAGWSQANINTFSNFLQNVIYPVVSPSGWDSWGGSANTMMMMIGVFNNDQTIYNQGYNNFIGTNPTNACFVGGLYDINSSSFGQSADSWRDQGHAQLGVLIGLEAAEIAWNSSSGSQNLYTFHSDLLVSACEYAAKYNLGHGVTWDDTFGTSPTWISSASRGKFWPFYTMAQAAFTYRASGLSFPYTEQVVAAEGVESALNEGGGMGTLLYTGVSSARPVPQYALYGDTSGYGYVMAGNSGANAVTATSPCIRNLETFQEIIQGNGYSAFKSVANGKYLTTTGTSTLIASSTTVGTQQEFKVVDSGIQYGLVSAVNGQYVEPQSGGTLIPNGGSSYYGFDIYAVGTSVPAVVTSLNGNTYVITNVYSGYVVDVSGAVTTNGGVVDQWAYNGGGNNQKWIFSNTANGFYTLKNVNSGLMLDVVGASTSEGALIDQWQSTGSLNQSWVVQFANYADGSGSYELYSANAPANLNVLEVPGDSTSQGTQLDQWQLSGGHGQEWNIP